MNSNIAAAWVVLSVFIGVMGCQKTGGEVPQPPSTPASLEAPVAQDASTSSQAATIPHDVQASKEPKASAVASDPGPEGALPASCQKLLACCTEWVKVTPTAEVGCSAQRNAFRAAKTKEARAQLGDLCQQALEAWSQLTNIPPICTSGLSPR